MVFTGPIIDIKDLTEIFPEDPFTEEPILGAKAVGDCLIVASGVINDDDTRPGQRLGGMELTPLR